MDFDTIIKGGTISTASTILPSHPGSTCILVALLAAFARLVVCKPRSPLPWLGAILGEPRGGDAACTSISITRRLRGSARSSPLVRPRCPR